MRKKHREKIISLTLTVLEELLRIGDATFNAFVDQKTFYKDLEANAFARRQIVNRVRDLINSGYIEAKEEGGRRSVRLTRKGRIKHLEKSDDIKTDGKWRFISFDIPDTLRNLRIQLTRHLRRIDYKPVQKSLWASPFIKAGEVNWIIEELRISQFVAYFVIEKTDIEKHLLELFDDALD